MGCIGKGWGSGGWRGVRIFWHIFKLVVLNGSHKCCNFVPVFHPSSGTLGMASERIKIKLQRERQVRFLESFSYLISPLAGLFVFTGSESFLTAWDCFFFAHIPLSPARHIKYLGHEVFKNYILLIIVCIDCGGVLRSGCLGGGEEIYHREEQQEIGQFKVLKIKQEG